MIENYKPIIHQYRRDLVTNNIVAEPRHEEIIVNPYTSLICLTEIPQEWERIKITDMKTNTIMVEVFNVEDIIDKKHFYVNYDNRTIYFHPDVRNKPMSIDYYGIGGEFFSANSIYTKTDTAGNVVETIQSILDAGDEAKQVIIKIGGIENVVSYLDNLKVESQAILDEAANKINNLVEINENINTYKTVTDEKINRFETQVNTEVENFKSDINTTVDEIKVNADKIVNESKAEMSNSMNDNLKYSQDKLDLKFANLAADVLGEINNIYNKVFPVGYVYQSTKSTSPVKLFGGEWDELGVGQVLVGAGTYTDKNGVTKTFTVRESYGEYEHTQTIEEMPRHSHPQAVTASNGSSSIQRTDYSADSPTGAKYPQGCDTYPDGGGKPFNVMQPSTPVYRWVRTKLSSSTTADLPNLIAEYLLDESIKTNNLANGCVTLNKLAVEVLDKLDKIDSLNNNFTQIKEQFNEIVASAGNDNTELVSARTNKEGKTYTTLGDRLDSMETNFIRLANDIADTDYKANDSVNVESLKLVEIQKLNSVLYKLRNGVDNVTFCHMGDSLTFGVDTVNGTQVTQTYADGTNYTNKQASTTYPMAMENYLKKVYQGNLINPHINRGRSGDWASSGYNRHNSKHSGDITLIMYGTNDSRNSNCPYVGNVEEYLYWMEQIVIRELIWGKAVVLLSSPIVKPSNDPKVDTFSNAVKMLGLKYNIPVIDTQELISGYPYDIWSDVTHLTSKGYDILGSRMASCFIGEGIINPNEVWGGCLVPIGAMKGSYVIKGDIVLKNSDVTIGDMGNDYGETTGYYYKIYKTENENTITFSFYTDEENLYVIPSLYLRSGTTLKLTLDNNHIGINQLASSVYLTSNSGVTNSPIKLITSTNSTMRYNKNYCKNNCDEPLRIPNKGWHTLTISIETKNDLTEDFVGTIFGLEFVSFDNMMRILSSPILLTNNPNKAKLVGETIKLNFDITKLNKLEIQTGSVDDKTLLTSTCKAYNNTNFKLTDIINCITDGGRFKATISGNKQITIVQCDNDLKYIRGVREI